MKLLIILLLASAAFGQLPVPGGGGGGSSINSYTVATLPASPATGTIATVTDGSTLANGCTVGGGSVVIACRYNGSAWAAWGDGNSGATPAWSALTAPTGAVSMVSDATAETATFDFRAAFTTGPQMLVLSSTGNPTGGILMEIRGHDADVTPWKATGDGTNGVQLSAAGSLGVIGTGAIVATGIVDNAVTLAKLADIATATVLGRSTAGSGDPEALTALPSAVMDNITRLGAVNPALSIAFGADPADTGRVRCPNNDCITAELATPGTDAYFRLNASDIWEASHEIQAPGFRGTGTGAGYTEFGQGTARTPLANSVARYAPTSITTAYGIVEPTAVGATGVVKVSVSGAVATLSHAALVESEIPSEIMRDSELAAFTVTKTNMTYDAEGTGNVFSIPYSLMLPAANCQNATAITGWAYGTSGFPGFGCVTGTNTVYGEALFDADADEALIVSTKLPSDWVAPVDLMLTWRAAATTGAVNWGWQTACVADGETGDPSWNAAQYVSDTTKGTTLQWNDTALQSAITVTGCAAGETLFVRVFRDGDGSGGTDSMTGDAGLLFVRLTLRRTI